MNFELLNSPTDGHKMSGSYGEIAKDSHYTDAYSDTPSSGYYQKETEKTNFLRNQIFARQNYQTKCICSDGKCTSTTVRPLKEVPYVGDETSSQGNTTTRTYGDL